MRRSAGRPSTAPGTPVDGVNEVSTLRAAAVFVDGLGDETQPLALAHHVVASIASSTLTPHLAASHTSPGHPSSGPANPAQSTHGVGCPQSSTSTAHSDPDHATDRARQHNGGPAGDRPRTGRWQWAHDGTTGRWSRPALGRLGAPPSARS
jgi:hypothetical protein